MIHTRSGCIFVLPLWWWDVVQRRYEDKFSDIPSIKTQRINMTIGVYSRGVSFLYTFEILKWGKRDTYKKWKFRQIFQRHFIRPKSMGLQHIASTLSTRVYILIPELLVIQIFLRNIRVKKWCNQLNSERSSSRDLNWNERYFITIIDTVDV